MIPLAGFIQADIDEVRTPDKYKYSLLTPHEASSVRPVSLKGPGLALEPFSSLRVSQNAPTQKLC